MSFHTEVNRSLSLRSLMREGMHSPFFLYGAYGALFVLVVVFHSVSLIGFDHNDHMYAAAASMDGRLYSEVYFVQAPLGFFFLKTVQGLAPEGYGYLLMRLSTVVLYALTLFFATLTLQGMRYRLLLLMAFLGSSYVLRIVGEIGSYSLPLVFLILSVWLLLGRVSLPRLALAALLTGLAASCKLSYIVFFPALLPTLIARLRSVENINRRWAEVSVIALSGVTGLAPLGYFALAEGAQFWLHNVTFHSELTNAMRGITLSLTFRSIGVNMLGFFLSGDGVLVVLALFNFMLLWWKSRCLKREDATLVLLLFLAAVSAVAPKIIFAQYLFPLSVIGCLAFVYSLERVVAAGCRYRVVLILALIVITLMVAARVRFYLQHRERPHVFTEVMKVNRALAAFRPALSEGSVCTPDMLTYSGALAVDSGFRLHSASTAGIFWVRLRDVVQELPKDHAVFRVPEYLFDPLPLLEAGEVHYVLTGYYLNAPEKRLTDYLGQAGWKPVIVTTFYDKTLTLWMDLPCQRARERKETEVDGG